MKNIISIVTLLLFVNLSVNAQDNKEGCEQTKTCKMDKKTCSEEQMKTCSEEERKNCTKDKKEGCLVGKDEK
jgi:hypothetical protein